MIRGDFFPPGKGNYIYMWALFWLRIRLLYDQNYSNWNVHAENKCRRTTQNHYIPIVVIIREYSDNMISPYLLHIYTNICIFIQVK